MYTQRRFSSRNLYINSYRNHKVPFMLQKFFSFLYVKNQHKCVAIQQELTIFKFACIQQGNKNLKINKLQQFLKDFKVRHYGKLRFEGEFQFFLINRIFFFTLPFELYLRAVSASVISSTGSQSGGDLTAFDKSLKKRITKIFYCQSSLENNVSTLSLKVVTYSLVPLKNGLIRHDELIFEVDDEIYFLVYFGSEGMLIFKSISRDQLLKMRTGNEIVRTKTPSSSTKVQDLVSQLKKMPNTSSSYSTLIWNCKDFASSLWNKF